MNSFKRQVLKIYKTVYYIFYSNFKANPVILITSMSISIVQGLSYGVVAKYLKYFFDSVEISIQRNYLTNETVFNLICLLIIIALSMLINGCNNGFHNLVEGRIKETALLNLHNKSKKLTPYAFEDTAILDNMQKAREGADASSNLLFILILVITFYIPSLAYLMIFFYSVYPMLALTLPIIFIPTIISQMFRIKIFDEFADRAASKTRELNGLENSIVAKNFFKETRLLGLFPYLHGKYINCLNDLLRERWQSEKKIAIRECMLRLFSFGAYIIIIVLATYLLIVGHISQGSFAAILSTVGFMFSTLEELIFYHIGTIFNNIAYVNNYVNYMTLPEAISENEKPVSMNSKIILENISFSYPNQKNLVIYDINLTIKKGESIALVGVNGVGKSTLAKIIIGFYPPKSGLVKYDDTIVENKNLFRIFENISGVMQNFNNYKFSLRDNVTISYLSKNVDEKKVLKALDDSEINIDKFNNGLNTMLSTEFNGIDLSRGEWQKLSIARALYKDSNIFIMDEPTAAIDPETESKIYASIKKVICGKTSLIITHRLGITKYVDRIIVLKDGSIVENGSHDELMSFDSNYRKMYLSQTKWYDFKEY